MNEVRSNSSAEVTALLEQAKGHIARGIEYHRMAREAILAVRQLDPKMSRRRIAKELGCSHRWVNALLKWDGTDGSTPFAGTQPVKIDDDDSSIRHEADVRPVLRNLDVVVMGEHFLVVGDATKANIKLLVLERAGLPYLREFFGADDGSDGTGLMDVVVVTDPPYGQNKDGILNDMRADWGEV